MDSVSTAFELMAMELSNAVEDLNADGVRSFKASDYVEAKRLTEHGLKLRAFCERVEALAKEWSEVHAPSLVDNTSVMEDAEVARTILSASKGGKTGLLVRFSDGAIFSEPKAADTFARVIEKIGFDRVSRLGIKVNREDLVSRKKSERYGEVYIAPHYIKTHSNTDQKRRILEQISSSLGLGLEITII